ncbi:MAG: hypothetical protein QW270_07030 [Candidatus Bathyarchaeia archaeon]
MAERKSKRDANIVEVEPEDASFILEPTQVEVGSGYTVSVNYDENEKPIVNIKTYGKVDLTQIKKEIERLFPNAQIRQTTPAQTVTIARKNKKKKSARK